MTPAPHGSRSCDIGTVHDPHQWGVPAPWENRWRYDCPGIEPDIPVTSTSCCRMARSDVCAHGADKQPDLTELRKVRMAYPYNTASLHSAPVRQMFAAVDRLLGYNGNV